MENNHCEKCVRRAGMAQPAFECGDVNCPCHSKETPRDMTEVMKKVDKQVGRAVERLGEEKPAKWEERLMDEFCVMFERATRNPDDANMWVEKLEDFIRRLRKETLEEARRCVPGERGSEAQVQATHCGLYHWNDCREATLKNIDDLRSALRK